MAESSGWPGGEGLHEQLLESWLELSAKLEEQVDLKTVLFDRVTGLPTTPLLFPQIEAALAESRELAILCLNVVKYSRIEEIYGWQVFDEIMLHIAEALRELTGKGLRKSDTIAELMISGNAFVILLSPPREQERIRPSDLDNIQERVEAQVCDHLKKTVPAAVFQKFGCYLGSAIVFKQENVRLERLVYEALESALVASGEREKRHAQQRRAKLRQIIDDEEVHTLYHPVVRLADRQVIGYEALNRGPADGEFERPDKLFKIAYDADLVIKLERLCRRKAFAGAERLPKGMKLFINMEPESVADPELRQIMSTTLLSDLDLTPTNMVLEITERSAILDFTVFRSTLEYLRALGFSVAIDDAGAGYASLQCIAEVDPDFLKLDMSLIRDIDADPIKQHLVQTLVMFGEKTGAKLVAEGIETMRELKTLIELGVEYGQGYLFAYPSEPFPEIRDLGDL